jgi:hypothetical protein
VEIAKLKEAIKSMELVIKGMQKEIEESGNEWKHEGLFLYGCQRILEKAIRDIKQYITVMTEGKDVGPL